MKKITTYLFLILFCPIGSILSQDSLQNIQINKVGLEKYEELQSDVKFDKTKNKLVPKKFDKPKKKDKELEKDLAFYDALSFFQIIPYLVIIFLIGLILYLIFSNVELDKKIEPSLSRSFEFEDIEEVDTVNGYKEALANGDYRSAIRWQFISVLQLLSKNETIDWQQEKTNRIYMRELRGKPQSRIFNTLVQIFENVWYGNHDIDESIFKELNIPFNSFIDEQEH